MQFAYEPADGWPSGYFLAGEVVCRAESRAGVLVPAPLEERAGGVDEQACFPLGDGDGGQVDSAGHVDGGAGVADGDREMFLPVSGRSGCHARL